VNQVLPAVLNIRWLFESRKGHLQQAWHTPYHR
jgi:hypothetical protein